MTFNEYGNAMIDQASSLRQSAATPEEGRDLSLAITYLEEALSRYNSSRYRAMGVWKRADPDAALAAVADERVPQGG